MGRRHARAGGAALTRRARRAPEQVVGDLLAACDSATVIVRRGRTAFDDDEILRLAAEAVLGRIGDATQKLHQRFGEELPAEIPWRDVIGNRVVVDHVYHAIDYDTVWRTLVDDVPALREAVRRWARERDLLHPHFAFTATQSDTQRSARDEVDEDHDTTVSAAHDEPERGGGGDSASP